MSKEQEFDPNKYYTITVKFVKKGDKVKKFMKEIKKRKDWVSPWWVDNRRYD